MPLALAAVEGGAQRPAQRAGEQQPVAQQHRRVAPVHQRRVEEDENAREGQKRADHPSAREALPGQQHAQRQRPHLHGVGQHGGPPRRHDPQADGAQVQHPGDLQQPDEGQRPALPRRRQEGKAQHPRQQRQNRRRPGEAQKTEGQRPDVGQGQLHQGPVGAPEQNDPRKLRVDRRTRPIDVPAAGCGAWYGPIRHSSSHPGFCRILRRGRWREVCVPRAAAPQGAGFTAWRRWRSR